MCAQSIDSESLFNSFRFRDFYFYFCIFNGCVRACVSWLKIVVKKSSCFMLSWTWLLLLLFMRVHYLIFPPLRRRECNKTWTKIGVRGRSTLRLDVVLLFVFCLDSIGVVVVVHCIVVECSLKHSTLLIYYSCAHHMLTMQSSGLHALRCTGLYTVQCTTSFYSTSCVQEFLTQTHIDSYRALQLLCCAAPVDVF